MESLASCVGEGDGCSSDGARMMCAAGDGADSGSAFRPVGFKLKEYIRLVFFFSSFGKLMKVAALVRKRKNKQTHTHTHIHTKKKKTDNSRKNALEGR